MKYKNALNHTYKDRSGAWVIPSPIENPEYYRDVPKMIKDALRNQDTQPPKNKQFYKPLK
jgi:hypothetical protein